VAVMLFKLSEDIAECYRRAEEARQKAEEAADPSIVRCWHERGAPALRILTLQSTKHA